jgi:sarcosine oxidase, subunit beta
MDARRSARWAWLNPVRYFRPWQMWRRHELKRSYDVVIVGGGAHGLAIAYELAKCGIRKVAVLDKSYIGAGGSGRNTTIIRANYRTPEGVAFYKESLRLYEHLAQELDYNLLFSQQGHLTLAHAERAVITAQERAEVNRLLGVDSRVIFPDEIGKLCPALDLSDRPELPIMAALYHPPGGVIRHDAVVWAYARMADRMGVEIHQDTEVTGIDVDAGRVTGVRTSRGDISAPVVVSAVAGWSSEVARMAGVRMPITTHPLQAFVTEPLKPFLDVILVSATLHVYVSQTDRGEVLIGSEIEPYSSYSQSSTLNFLEVTAKHTLELLPTLGKVRLMRAWGGLCDVTPDYSPIMGKTEVEGFLVDAGWGTYGFKATPICGVTMAELVQTGLVPDLIKPFELARFWKRELVSEIAAAAVSH